MKHLFSVLAAAMGVASMSATVGAAEPTDEQAAKRGVSSWRIVGIDSQRRRFALH